MTEQSNSSSSGGEFYPVAFLFTDEELQALIESGSRVSSQFWAWGDLISAKVEQVRARYQVDETDQPSAPVTSLYAYIASLIGRSVRSVREYRKIAEFYPHAVREQYQPLPFDTFKLAYTFGPRWRDVLDAGIEYVERHGRLPTREWLEGRFYRERIEQGRETVEETPPLWQPVTQESSAEQGSQAQPSGNSPSVALHVLIYNLTHLSKVFQAVTRVFPLRDETRRRVETVIASLEDAILAVQSESDPAEK